MSDHACKRCDGTGRVERTGPIHVDIATYDGKLACPDCTKNHWRQTPGGIFVEDGKAREADIEKGGG